MDDVKLVSLELIVADLDAALALWTDVLHFELVDRAPTETIAGEIAIVTDGHLAITLLRPADAGPGHVLHDRTPRLSQIVLQSTDVADLARSVSEAGLAVSPTATGFYVTPESVGGALGSEVAVVVADADDV